MKIPRQKVASKASSNVLLHKFERTLSLCLSYHELKLSLIVSSIIIYDYVLAIYPGLPFSSIILIKKSWNLPKYQGQIF